jgi:uncharacterized protein YdiU (UPF0061 family)
VGRPTPRRRAQTSGPDPYRRLSRIDGRHPFKQAAPEAYVDYRARRLRDSEVAYFNFGLAREMGLIPAGHPDRLTAALRRTLLETFSLVILNEYDFLNGTRVPSRDLLPHSYMATRYLQLQHPDKRGTSSGDGRSIWNGCVTHRGVTWDVSSCGTGVTRLCPATSEFKTFFRTGNYITSYGCGTAALAEGINAAVMSEVFHRNDIPTERVLLVLVLPSGLAINVRAARNLLRPSHFFVHLRRGDLEQLRGTVDFFIDRQIANGSWPALGPGDTRVRRNRRYRHMAEDAARTFARITARFESDYIFCWLDWDGDNVLADGSIIDYGSVRQFGLYHREYRFEDTDRMSTTIPEQRRKARQIVQKYAQMRDYLIDGHKSRLDSYARDEVLEIFDAEFERTKRELLLAKLGFDAEESAYLTRHAADTLARFRRAFTSLERARSSRGPVRVPDGLSWNAIYCVRDLLRVLPGQYAARAAAEPAAPPSQLVSEPDEFFEIALSDYASRKDRVASAHRRRMAREFQHGYLALAEQVARWRRQPLPGTLDRLAERARIANHASRITGDSVDHASQRLIRRRRQLSPEAVYRLIRHFTDDQDLDPDRGSANASAGGAPRDAIEARVLSSLLRATHEFREGL